MFARIFENEDNGQVLVTKDENEDGAPQLKITFEFDGAVINYAPTYENSEDGIEKRNFYFNAITEHQVMANVDAIKRKLTANYKINQPASRVESEMI